MCARIQRMPGTLSLQQLGSHSLSTPGSRVLSGRGMRLERAAGARRARRAASFTVCSSLEPWSSDICRVGYGGALSGVWPMYPPTAQERFRARGNWAGVQRSKALCGATRCGPGGPMRLEQTDARMCASSRRLPILPSGARLWEKAHRWSVDAGGGRRAKRGGEEPLEVSF